MLKSFFIALSKARWMQTTITRMPAARRAASRFVAGETAADAIHAVQRLNKLGINATLDFLGENTSNLHDASLATDEVLSILSEIQASGVASNVSIKLSQFGLSLDEAACRQNLLKLLQHATQLGNFVRIDMEDTSLTQRTLDSFKWARSSGFVNTGIVIQSYLYRSPADYENLAKIQARIRLCKGAYQEPASLAFPKKKDVDNQYDQLAKRLMQSALEQGAPIISEDGRIPPLPALATHDPIRIQKAIAAAQSLKMPARTYEFQMLYGIRQDLQQDLVKSGHLVRVYVPYGSHWYPYNMRRLAERPANVYFFLSNLLRR